MFKRLFNKLFDFTFIDISEINRRIFSLPIKNVPPKKIVFNKHMQNMVWALWFGTLLHKEEEK